VTLNKIKNIVYIGYAPLTAKTSRDFFIDDLIKEGINVEYWDLSQYYFENLTINNSINESWIKKVNSMGEVKMMLSAKNNRETVYFINFAFTGKVLLLFRILTKMNITIFQIARGMIPVPASTVKKSVGKLFKAGMVKKVSNFAFNKAALLIKQMGLIKTFDRIYYAGEDALKIAGLGYEMDKQKAELIPINSSDYDHYLSLKGSSRLVEHKYVVFLDEYLPYHPDVHMFGLKTVKAEEYYISLNKFFDDIESRYNVKVIIAAHPKAVSYQTNNYFNQRDVFFFKTAELIKYAEFVFAHRSTAISLAVLFEKKLIFLYTNYMQEKMDYYYQGIHHLAKTLDTQLVNIDQPITIMEKDLNFNERMYDDFKYKFLTSKGAELSIAKDVFIKSFKKV